MFKIYLDIGPLQEREFTGIAQVTAKTAEALLGDRTVDAQFVFGDFLVPHKFVESILRHRSGTFFRYHFGKGELDLDCVHSLTFSPKDPVAGLYTNVKTSRGLYPVEGQIIYDLTPLLVPEYHTQDTIQHHAYTLAEDLASNDVTFCISEATRNDVITYFAVPREKTAICYLGADELATPTAQGETEVPYILVLGTLEPRKNLQLLFRALKKHPELLLEHRILVVGRIGWGEGIEATLQKAGIADAWGSGKLQFLGFIPEEEKSSLIQNATLMVYPSMFEGFGLPVLESLTAGVPVITTFSSSLPEVGGDAAYYCDPADDDSLWMTILNALGDIRSNPQAVAAGCREQASKFSWSRYYDAIKAGLMTAHQQKIRMRK